MLPYILLPYPSHTEFHPRTLLQTYPYSTVMYRRREAAAGERAPLVHSINGNSSSRTGGARLPPCGDINISSSSESSAVDADKYGSLVVGNGAAAAALEEGAGAEGFPEVGEVGEAGVVKIKKEKNINMEAAVLHAVTDLVSGREREREKHAVDESRGEFSEYRVASLPADPPAV